MSILGPHDAGRIAEALRALPLVGEKLGRVRVRHVDEVLNVLAQIHDHLGEVDEELARLRASEANNEAGGVRGE